jgi:hypothetical protein
VSRKLVIVSCSQRPEEESQQTLLVQSFEHGRFSEFADLDITWKNAEGLSAVYNRKLLKHGNAGSEYIVFVHDDVYVDDLKLYDKVLAARCNLGYQIIGVAGASSVTVRDPSLWHLMCGQADWRGTVHHFTSNGQIRASAFGPTPSQVAVMDGLFMAVHVPSVLAAGWRFNEDYDFHHYDIASCLDARAKGLKLGVYPIHLIHESPGLDSRSNPIWEASNERFLATYGKRSLDG